MTVFEDYLRERIRNGKDLRVIPTITGNDTVEISCAEIDGEVMESLHMVVKGNQLEPLMGAGEFASVIYRDPHQVNGPGVWFLYRGSQIVNMWPCITGGKILSPKDYGGLTPNLPSGMVMKYKVGVYEDLYNGQDHTVWLPARTQEAKELFPRRTWYNVGVDEFRGHQVGVNNSGFITGRSTGCTCPPDHVWEFAKKQLNLAFDHAEEHDYAFTTFVRNWGEEHPLLV